MSHHTAAGAVARRSISRRLVSLIGVAAFLALAFWIIVALPYFHFNREHFGPYPDLFWPRRYPLLLHILGGTVALLAGPLQLWLGETRRQLGWHRTLGKVYVSGVGVGLWEPTTSRSPPRPNRDGCMHPAFSGSLWLGPLPPGWRISRFGEE